MPTSFESVFQLIGLPSAVESFSTSTRSVATCSSSESINVVSSAKGLASVSACIVSRFERCNGGAGKEISKDEGPVAAGRWMKRRSDESDVVVDYVLYSACRPSAVAGLSRHYPRSPPVVLGVGRARRRLGRLACYSRKVHAASSYKSTTGHALS